MKTQVMVAFDRKAKVFLTPFFVSHTDVGIRAMSMAVMSQEPGAVIAQNPEDFSLWLLGTFDDDSGHFNLTASPVHVCEATNLIKNPFAQPDEVGAKAFDPSARGGGS